MIHAALYGRLTKDPQSRTTASGKEMTIATLAVDATPNNASEPETLWVAILAFGRQAETLERHRKGEMVAVTGRLTQSRWTGQEGEERTGLSLVVDTIVSSRTVRPGGKRKKDQGGNSCSEENQRLTTQTPEPGFDDPIPF